MTYGCNGIIDEEGMERAGQAKQQHSSTKTTKRATQAAQELANSLQGAKAIEMNALLDFSNLSIKGWQELIHKMQMLEL